MFQWISPFVRKYSNKSNGNKKQCEYKPDDGELSIHVTHKRKENITTPLYWRSSRRGRKSKEETYHSWWYKDRTTEWKLRDGLGIKVFGDSSGVRDLQADEIGYNDDDDYDNDVKCVITNIRSCINRIKDGALRWINYPTVVSSALCTRVNFKIKLH